MIVLKHVQYIEFTYGMKHLFIKNGTKHYQRERVIQRTLKITHSKKKLEVPQLLDQIKRKHAF